MKTLMIHGLEWKLDYVSPDTPSLNDEANEQCFGLTDFAQGTIFIRNDLDARLTERVLRHELTHAYLFSYGFIPEKLDEEGICNFVETYGPLICEKAQEAYESFVVREAQPSSCLRAKRV